MTAPHGGCRQRRNLTRAVPCGRAPLAVVRAPTLGFASRPTPARLPDNSPTPDVRRPPCLRRVGLWGTAREFSRRCSAREAAGRHCSRLGHGAGGSKWWEHARDGHSQDVPAAGTFRPRFLPPSPAGPAAQAWGSTGLSSLDFLLAASIRPSSRPCFLPALYVPAAASTPTAANAATRTHGSTSSSSAVAAPAES